MLARRTKLLGGRCLGPINKRSWIRNQKIVNGADSIVKGLSAYHNLTISGSLASTCREDDIVRKPTKRLVGGSSILHKLDSSLIGKNPSKLWGTKSISFGQIRTISNGQNMYKVWDIQAAKAKSREDEAQKILKEVATQVEPILMKHGWRVELLSEYFGNRMILGQNIGQQKEIRVRLRHFSDEHQFIPFVVIMDTMLHELCHNVYIYHGTCFHKLLNQLRKEYEEFVIAGTIKASSEEFDLGVVFSEPWEKITERLVKNTVSYGQNMDKVWAIHNIKNMPREDEARKILEEVARQVEPIMIKHGWRVKLLSEFRIVRSDGVPLGESSRGQYIQLRLRSLLRKDEFLPFNVIMDAMLHELCHNFHDDHNARFHELLGQLRKEYEDFVREGIIKASSKEFDLGIHQLNQWVTETVSYGQNMDKVWAIQYMKNMPREDEARKILEEVARQVEPIMMKHGWRIKLLSEFRSRILLGVNIRGQYVKLSLRKILREDKFIPFILIMDVMLHELCHNVHKDHSASFRELWDQLRKEYEEFVREGIIKASSEEFDLGGPRLAERLAESEMFYMYDSCARTLYSIYKTAISWIPKSVTTWVGNFNIIEKNERIK